MKNIGFYIKSRAVTRPWYLSILPKHSFHFSVCLIQPVDHIILSALASWWAVLLLSGLPFWSPLHSHALQPWLDDISLWLIGNWGGELFPPPPSSRGHKESKGPRPLKLTHILLSQSWTFTLNFTEEINAIINSLKKQDVSRFPCKLPVPSISSIILKLVVHERYTPYLSANINKNNYLTGPTLT